MSNGLRYERQEGFTASGIVQFNEWVGSRVAQDLRFKMGFEWNVQGRISIRLLDGFRPSADTVRLTTPFSSVDW